MSSETLPQVAVVGSLNIDHVARVEELPGPGETVAASDFDTYPGGKGANQAISVRRQGCEVHFFGSVGSDEKGEAYRESLEEEGIYTEHLKQVPAPTGSAFITVDGDGENFIVIAPGANSLLTARDIENGSPVLEECAALLCQFEVPSAAVIAALRAANRFSIPSVVNPSPVDPTFPWGEVRIDHLIVNEHEAHEILEFPPAMEDPSLVRQRLTEFRIEHLVVTRGGDETLVFPHTADAYRVATLPVLPVDTVGAGDAFAGCYTAWISRGETVENAVRAANCAGALATLGAGAQDPIPDLDKIHQHIDQIPKLES